MSTPQTQTQTQTQTLYFAYGSNLSLYQMSTRCPKSMYYGFGVLPSYRWIISGRGYANVVYSPAGEGEGEGEGRGADENAIPSTQENDITNDISGDTVEGLLYYLHPDDEARLDSAEGVPHAYTKHILDISILTPPTSKPSTAATANPLPETTVRALVYVDLLRISPGTCKEEYVARMNRGIRDARARGMSARYVEGVLRRWVRDEPVPGGGDGDGQVDDPFAPGT